MLNSSRNHHIEDALNHFNNALDDIDCEEPPVYICRTLFDALNKLQNAWLILQEPTQRDQNRETNNFIEMITENFSKGSGDELIKRNELMDFISLDPSIMDHQILRRKNYDPRNISSDLQEKASKKHDQLKKDYGKYLEKQTPELQRKVIREMADVLYMVRSNIAHGEKTPRGPDIDKVKRDEKVSRIAIPLLIYLFKNMVGDPDNFFIVYGTLSPGSVNHSILSDVAGIWTECKIIGKIQSIDNLPVFSQSGTQSSINAHLLESKDLTSYWDKIDQFEGISYKRRLISAWFANGKSIVANIYLPNTRS